MRALRRSTLVALLAMLALVGLVPAQAHAQDDEDPQPQPSPQGQWAVQPGGESGPGDRPNFAYTLPPGSAINDVVTISNLSDRTITFAIYPKDAYNTPRDAAFALQDDDEEPQSVGSWITFLNQDTGEYELDQIDYTLDPMTRVDIPFQLDVPANAEPGDHAGGIIAADVDPVETIDEDGVAIAVRQRIGSRVYVRVDGPTRAELEVTDINVDHRMPVIPWVTGRGDMAVTYEITNSGNVRLESVATVKVTGIFGRTVREFPLQTVPELMPRSSVILTQSFSGLPPVELLNVAVVVESIDGEVETSRSQRVFVWSWAVLVILLAILGYIGYRIWRRRQARKPATTPAGPDETTTEVATGSGADVASAEPVTTGTEHAEP